VHRVDAAADGRVVVVIVVVIIVTIVSDSVVNARKSNEGYGQTHHFVTSCVFHSPADRRHFQATKSGERAERTTATKVMASTTPTLTPTSKRVPSLATRVSTTTNRRVIHLNKGRENKMLAELTVTTPIPRSIRTQATDRDGAMESVSFPVVTEDATRAMSRRGAMGAFVALASASASASARADGGPMCGYFDEYANGLAPRYAYTTPWNEGVVGDKTFVRGVGDYKKAKKAKKAPVLAVCNGPGIPHDYFSALETLSGEADGAREVFLYDQRGCGRSASVDEDWLADGGFEALNRYADELNRLVDELRLVPEGGAHVVAHGYWGAKLATTLARTTPGAVKTLTLVSPTASRAEEVDDWRRALNDGAVVSSDTRKAILDYERDLDPSLRDAYDSAMHEFADAFVARRSSSCFETTLALGRQTDTQRRALTGGRYFIADGSLAKDSIFLDGLGTALGRNGVSAVRIVRGSRDAVSSAAARRLVDAINAESSAGAPFCAYDEVDGAGSCVFLDRADYFYETLNTCVEAAERA